LRVSWRFLAVKAFNRKEREVLREFAKKRRKESRQRELTADS
jgi:hypothetical protein